MASEIYMDQTSQGSTWKADIQISRRKRCHAITDGQEEVTFWAYTLGEVFEYLRDRDVRKIEIETDQGYWSIDLQFIKPRERVKNG